MNDDWYKVDNVAKVFLADHSARNPQTLRVSCILKEEIDPLTLQTALDETIVTLPQFQVRMRRGFFWNYMEKTEIRPVVVKESGRPCPVLYGPGAESLLHYKVSYLRNRINLEVFHAIADGTGAIKFLNVLVLNYLRLKHPGELDQISLDGDATSGDRFQNSFEHFYDNSNGPIPKNILNKKKKAYHLLSRKLPYYQLRFFEMHLQTSVIKTKSKDAGVGMTSYIGAALMMAIRAGMPFMQRKKPVTISMPVNLRNYYPSETIRNFFNNVDFSHVFTDSETLESLAKEFDVTLKDSLSPEHINAQMNRYQSMERVFFTRMVPLFLKQPVVKFFSRKDKKTVTAVLSNLGVVKFPPEMDKYIEGFTDYCSTESFFVTVTSYKDDLVLGISSAYSGTGTIRRLLKIFEDAGSSIKLYVSDVII